MARHPELLIPASSLEVLKTAVIFGADAVYIGGEAFGLRAKAKNFSLDDMKLARKALKKEVDEELRKEQTISNRNKVVEEMTKPIKNIDSNYIESAECPNCHKKAVYRISDFKRGASIGLFGLFSKNIVLKEEIP